MDYDVNDKISRMYHVSTSVISPSNAAGRDPDGYHAVQAPRTWCQYPPCARHQYEQLNSYTGQYGSGFLNIFSLDWRRLEAGVGRDEGLAYGMLGMVTQANVAGLVLPAKQARSRMRRGPGWWQQVASF